MAKIYTIPNIITGNDPNTNKNSLKFKNSADLSDHNFQPMRTVRQYSEKKSSLAAKIVSFGKDQPYNIYTDSNKSFPLNYLFWGKGYRHFSKALENEMDRYSFPYFNYDDIYDITDSNYFKDKIVIVGHIGSTKLGNIDNDKEDKYKIPADTNSLIFRDRNTPGCIIHANAVLNLLNKTKFYYFSDFIIYFFTFLVLISYIYLIYFKKNFTMAKIFL